MLLHGDVLEMMKTLDDKSVNCVITSPPYWQLRDYNFPEQWGLEPTYQEYLEHLWQMMDEIWRVLRDDGTCWINLGDCYSGSGNGSWNAKIEQIGKQHRKTTETGRTPQSYLAPGTGKANTNLPSKCLMLIPHRFAIGCIDRGWIMRNDIIWAKRNGMPESCRDRFSKKHEYFFFMVKQQKYYFDLDGVRDSNPNWKKDYARVLADYNGGGKKHTQGGTTSFKTKNLDAVKERLQKGKNPGDVSDFWDIPTKPSKKKHYATYNFDLIDKCIIAGCPEYVCKKCGKPREKIIETEYKGDSNKRGTWYQKGKGQSSLPKNAGKTKRKIIGLTDCGCNAGFEGGTILDPFNGIGTTTLRADQLNRKWIGIDGSKEYHEQAQKAMEIELKQIKLKL